MIGRIYGLARRFGGVDVIADASMSFCFLKENILK
jgi:hypothetical protein